MSCFTWFGIGMPNPDRNNESSSTGLLSAMVTGYFFAILASSLWFFSDFYNHGSVDLAIVIASGAFFVACVECLRYVLARLFPREEYRYFRFVGVELFLAMAIGACAECILPAPDLFYFGKHGDCAVMACAYVLSIGRSFTYGMMLWYLKAILTAKARVLELIIAAGSVWFGSILYKFHQAYEAGDESSGHAGYFYLYNFLIGGIGVDTALGIAAASAIAAYGKPTKILLGGVALYVLVNIFAYVGPVMYCVLKTPTPESGSKPMQSMIDFLRKRGMEEKAIELEEMKRRIYYPSPLG